MQMRSFKKMAREKKVKVLTFVVFLCVVNWFCGVKAVDVPKLMHIIRDGTDGLEAVCLAFEKDAYLAADWTYPIAQEYENQPQIVTYFLPNRTSGDFNCNFEKDQTCVESWKSNVWHVPKETDRNFEAIFDYRWEEFKIHLITRNTTILSRRLDIQPIFNVTLSIRSDHSVEIWFCEGWLPEKHACYTISLGSKDKKSVVLTNSKNKTLTSFAGEEHILSFDQWKSFRLSLSPSGTFRIVDLIKNVDLVNFTDETPLKPIYLFMNSDMPSLWKIHQNNFLFTNVSKETTFGPNIKMTSPNLCISMFLTMCERCNLTFYLKENNTKNVLLRTNGNNTSTWKQVKILIQNYTEDNLQVFVETEGPENAFWLIDNVRICSPLEVRVMVLRSDNKTGFNITDHEVSCHALLMQQWRPKPYRMKPNIGPLEITKQEFNTSVKLSWKSVRIYDDQLPFIVKYQGHHLCPGNVTLKNTSLDRIKSNDAVLVQGNEVTINNLIPYTHYRFTLVHPIYKNLTKEFVVNTNETENITEFERPKNVHMWLTSTSLTLVQDAPSCNDLHGRILYKYSIDDLPATLSENTAYSYTMLEPFTNYTLKIETSRNLSGLRSGGGKYVSYYNFTTKPTGIVAPPLSYLDVYETTKNSVSLRYKLPNVTTGIPERVYVTYCNGLLRSKCNFLIENITECIQYPQTYCVRVTKLIRNEKYKFKVSIKNKDTHTNGNDTVVTATAKSNLPGKVSNLNYTVIHCSDTHEYCNFNISWQHPWDQNGPISAFHIELMEVGTTKGLDDIYLIKNREYKPTYWHEIQYLPYATTYSISVRAVYEDFKGSYVTIQGKIDHIGEHIDQIPDIVEVSPYSLAVEIPALDARIDSAVITVIVQSVVTEHIDEDMWKIGNENLCFEVAETWLAKVLEFSRSKATTFVIGDGETEFSDLYNRDVTNKELLPDSEYCLTYVVQNTYKNVTHKKVYHWQQRTSAFLPEAHELSSNVLKIMMILLTLVVLSIIVVLIAYKFRHRLYCRKVRQDGEHIYESMPFDEYNDEPNVVYNVTYDKLIHN